MFPVFDPRDAACKSPFGAVACGAEVSFTLRDGDYYACELLVHREFAGVDEVCPLPPAEGGFSGIYTAPQEPDLCWYAFRFTRADGSTVCYGRSGWCGQDALVRWQLTVYEDTPTPAWFGQGVTYQIFPDRFRRTSVPDVGGMVGRRWVHDNWSDQPVFLPDEQGQITNRDFFGGSLAGITEKLDYLKSLSVSTIYLNPIFEADSNHRYNTADYHAIDPMLGSEEDFRTLCREAHARDIRIILDGVFNHTGSNSRYFNAEGFYPEPGAAQSTESPYFSWYSFHPWPTDYDAWWGVHTLPAVNEEQPDYRRFIISDKDSVVRHWLRDGADGWRLDVADELPDDFIAAIRDAIQAEKPNGYLLGEVWEDGSNKIAYSRRRRYLLGRETHGLMNYPLRTAALDYLRGGSAAAFRDTGSFDAAGSLSQENAEAFCRDFCKAFSYDTPIFTLDETGSGTATAVRLWNGTPVFNAAVTFTIDQGRVLSASGALLPEAGAETSSGQKPLSAFAALTAFQQMRHASSSVVSSITEVSLCYELQSTTAAPMALVPSWRIVTDTATFYVNCISGTVRRA